MAQGLSTVEAVTLYALPNEKAFQLMELPLAPHQLDRRGPGRRRYQILWLNRDDRIARYVRDLGPAQQFQYPALRIPSLWEHTVSELQYMADEMREDTWPLEIVKQRQQESDLKERLEQRFYNRQAHRRATSVFGPAVRIERTESRRT